MVKKMLAVVVAAALMAGTAWAAEVTGVVNVNTGDQFGAGDVTFTGANTGLTANAAGLDVANNLILSGSTDTTITNTTQTDFELILN